MATGGSNIEQLTALKLQKLQEQKDISDKMTALLSEHLRPNCKEACKNQKSAIAMSKQPGNFPYHQSSQQVQDIEKGRTLNKLARQVSKMDGELTALTE